MTAIQVHFHIGTTDSAVSVPEPTGTAWVTDWRPGDRHTPDVWYAVRKVGDCIEAEVEVSNASFHPGCWARPDIPHVTVTVSAGAGWTLVQGVARPWPSVWPIKRGAWRRFGVYPSGRADLRLQAQILARGQLYNPIYSSWGPANMPLPSLNPTLASKLAADWNGRYLGLRSALPNPSGWYAEDSEDSPRAKGHGWVVHGPDDPGAPAGSGVYFSTGWQRCVDFARYALLMCQPCHERMWLAYNRQTGEPITVDDYGSVTPKYSPGTHDPNNNDLPGYRGIPTNQIGLPDPYDTAHRIRHDRYPIAAFEFTGSPMARRMVLHAAAQCRLQWSERGETDQWSYNIKNMFLRVQANPHQGLSGTYGGRSLGEPAFVIAAAKKFGATDADDWAKMFLGMVGLAAPAHGVIQRNNEPGGGAWDGGANDLAHSFEVPMLGIGTLALARQFNLPIPKQIATAMRAVFVDSPLRDYYSGNRGPWDYLYVGAHNGAAYQAITGGQTTPGAPEGDATHAALGCAIGYSITKDPAFLDASARVGLPAPSWQAKRENLYGVATDLGWDAFLLGQYQGVV